MGRLKSLERYVASSAFGYTAAAVVKSDPSDLRYDALLTATNAVFSRGDESHDVRIFIQRLEPRWLTVETLAVYISRSVAAVRGLVRRRQIPYVKQGVTVYFDRHVIDNEWMRGPHRALPKPKGPRKGTIVSDEAVRNFVEAVLREHGPQTLTVLSETAIEMGVGAGRVPAVRGLILSAIYRCERFTKRHNGARGALRWHLRPDSMPADVAPFR